MLRAAIDSGIAKAALADAIDYAQNQAWPILESGVTRASNDPYVMSAVGEMRVAASVAEVVVLSMLVSEMSRRMMLLLDGLSW